METIQYPTKVKSKKEHKCNFCNGKINKGNYYLKSIHKYDVIYTWKTHIHCSEIADKLRMYDHCDEGLTSDIFIETIKEEYNSIMQKNQQDFDIPKFIDRLSFVLEQFQIVKDNDK